MKLLDRSYVWVSALMALMLAGFSAQAFASHITAYPDTAIVHANMGSSNAVWIAVSDGRDTTQMPHTPLTTVSVSISGSSELTEVSGTTLSFFGLLYVQVNFAPTSSGMVSATLTVTGDSNTVTVAILGVPNDHLNLTIRGDQSFQLRPGRDTCHTFAIHNPNSFSVSITDITLTFSDSLYTLANVPTLPATLAANSEMNFQVCAKGSQFDSNYYTSNIRVDYSYSTGKDYTGLTLIGKTIPFNTTCINLTGPSGPSFGAVAAGSSKTMTFTLSNLTDSAATVDSARFVSGDYAQFSIVSPSFPVTIGAHLTQSVDIQFSVPSSTTRDNYSAKGQFWCRGTSPDALPCSDIEVGVSGSVFIPIVDTITLNIPADDTSSLSISATTTRSRHLILFHNATSGHIEVTSLGITNSDSIAFFNYFTNESVSIFDSINAGATVMGPLLSLEVDSVGTYDIGLVLTYVNALQSAHYTVHAHRLPNVSAAVNNPTVLPTVGFTMNPNPAHGEVTITLPAEGNSTVEIYDVLGNLLLSKQASGRFVWDGTSTGDAATASGSYIVRVTGRHADGTIASSAKRLVFVR